MTKTVLTIAAVAAGLASAAAFAAPAAAPAAAMPAGDATHGAVVFNQCKTCHVADKGVNRIGPSLFGVVGRHSGTIPNFRYSAANKNSGLVWNEATLFKYLEAPQKTIPGTYMTFAGLKNPKDRADVIAFLKTKA